MNQFELRHIEQQLRDALGGTTLSWVLDDVDAAIAAGVPEEKILRRRRSQRRDDSPDVVSPAAAAARYEVVDRGELGPAEYETSRKRGTLVIATRAMTDEERVQVLLDAVRRVIVELPEMELATLKILHPTPEERAGDRSEVESITFESDESTQSPQSRSNFQADRMPERRQHVSQLLAEIAREVRS